MPDPAGDLSSPMARERVKKSTSPVNPSEARNLLSFVFKEIKQMDRFAQHDSSIFSRVQSHGRETTADPFRPASAGDIARDYIHPASTTEAGLSVAQNENPKYNESVRRQIKNTQIKGGTWPVALT